MAWRIVFTNSGFWKYSWALLVISMTESCRWVMQCRLRPCPLHTEIYTDSLNLLIMLCTVDQWFPAMFLEAPPTLHIFHFSFAWHTQSRSWSLYEWADDLNQVWLRWHGKHAVLVASRNVVGNHYCRWWDLQSLCNLTLRSIVLKFSTIFFHTLDWITDWRAFAHLYFWETLPL